MWTGFFLAIFNVANFVLYVVLNITCFGKIWQYIFMLFVLAIKLFKVAIIFMGCFLLIFLKLVTILGAGIGAVLIIVWH